MDIQKIDKRINNINLEISSYKEIIKKEKEQLEFLLKNSHKSNFSFLDKNLNVGSNSTESNSTVINTEEYLEKRKQLSNTNFFNEIKALIKDIPDSNGSRYFDRFDINVGIVADEFLFHSLDDVANFHYLTNSNYKELAPKLDFFFVATTWRGLNMEWRGLANDASNRRKELYEMIDYFKSIGKKTVFYSKEDPVNYEKFVNIAKKCDYIFTTAEEIVPRYKEECKNENVFVLEFGVNPLFHNPIGFRDTQKFKDVFFAGSWLTKYPDRQIETQHIFDGVLKANRKLRIIDRNYAINHPDYFFPEKYLPYISPAIEHEYLQKVHKLYDWAVNLNSVKYSNTMFANRVYELQAIGNIILSNYSVGVNNLFPNVFIINNDTEVADIINGFDETDVYKHQVKGIRNVMSNYTTFHRFDSVLNNIGIESKIPKHKVLVVVDEINESILSQFNRQSYPYKDLIKQSDLNEEIKKSYKMITFFKDAYSYEEFYLEDLVNAFKYTDSDFVTKSSYFNANEKVEGIEHNYVSEVNDKYKTVFWLDAFELEQLTADQLNIKNKDGYSIDPFELNTSKVIELPPVKTDYKLSVIIPVYNNGRHLSDKCFNSLVRSHIFNDMEIIIVDDGSTDEYTHTVVNRLERNYTNVKVFKFNDNGSGSASRPRNKGIELATTDYITYLDPDNEAVNNGYHLLLNELHADPQLDMVVGSMLKLDNVKASNFRYYKSAIDVMDSNIITDTRDFLIKVNMRAQSIQALIVKKSIIVDNNLQMILNAGGQDTLFFQELLLNSKKVKVIDEFIHIYYAAVVGSVTNTLTNKFFTKFHILEKERLPFLVKNDLLTVYMEKRFTFYFKNWYLKRLSGVKPEDLKQAIDTIYEIYSLYKDSIVVEDKTIQRFEELYLKKKYDEILLLCS